MIVNPYADGVVWFARGCSETVGLRYLIKILKVSKRNLRENTEWFEQSDIQVNSLSPIFICACLRIFWRIAGHLPVFHFAITHLMLVKCKLGMRLGLITDVRFLTLDYSHQLCSSRKSRGVVVEFESHHRPQLPPTSLSRAIRGLFI